MKNILILIFVCGLVAGCSKNLPSSELIIDNTVDEDSTTIATTGTDSVNDSTVMVEGNSSSVDDSVFIPTATNSDTVIVIDQWVEKDYDQDNDTVYTYYKKYSDGTVDSVYSLTYAELPRDTIYTWIEEYSDLTIDTLLKFSSDFISLSIDTTLNEYNMKCFMASFRIAYFIEPIYDTIYINYTEKKLISKIRSDVNVSSLADFTAMLDTVYTDSVENFPFKHKNLAYTFIDKPAWFHFYQTDMVLEIDGDYIPGLSLVSHEGCCEGITYPRIIRPVEGNTYTFFANTEGVDSGAYEWQVVVSNFYGYTDTVTVSTTVLDK